jgi:ABC-type transport system involved in multi-copper enzyme maturation permease subunit
MIAFGYAHPLILISLSILPISMPARYISAEIESRNFDIFFSKPIHRSVVPTHLFIFIMAASALQVLAILVGTLLANAQFSLDLQMYDFTRIALLAFFFYLSMSALALTAASLHNERGKALSRIIGIFVFFYFYDTIIRVNDSLKTLRAFSYFSLYQPSEIIMHKTSVLQDVFVCMFLTAVFLTLSILQFNRRDL